VGMVARGHVAAALGSLVQFVHQHAALFLHPAPAAMNTTRRGRGRGFRSGWPTCRPGCPPAASWRYTNRCGTGDAAWPTPHGWLARDARTAACACC
jgi:hypothetical protein